MITLKNITKTYGGSAQVQALKGINLTIEDGEIFGIIGKSGAGKSTLVRCINMLEKPTSGQVIIDDKDLTKMSESQLRAERKNIGMIFQHFNPAGTDWGLERRHRKESRISSGPGRPQRPGRQLPVPALGRPETACRHCPRPGQRPEDPALRRSDVRPGPADDEIHPGTAPGHQQAPGHHHRRHHP